MTTSGVLPVPWRSTATSLVDPVTRSSAPIKNIDYRATPLDAIAVNLPGLSKSIPAAGTRISTTPALFNAEAWFKKEAGKINKSQLSPAEKDLALEQIATQAQKYKLDAGEQVNLMKAAGVPVDKMNLDTYSVVPSAENLQKLVNMGIGGESIKFTDKGKISMPRAEAVMYSDPMMQLIRFFGGLNLKPVPRKSVQFNNEFMNEGLQNINDSNK